MVIDILPDKPIPTKPFIGAVESPVSVEPPVLIGPVRRPACLQSLRK